MKSLQVSSKVTIKGQNFLCCNFIFFLEQDVMKRFKALSDRMGKSHSYYVWVQNSHVTILCSLHLGTAARSLTGSFKPCDKKLVVEYTVEVFSVATQMKWTKRPDHYTSNAHAVSTSGPTILLNLYVS